MKSTYHEKIINALRAVGSKGIHSFDMRQIGGLQAPIRILELKREGFNIKSIPEKKGNANGCRYILVTEIVKEQTSVKNNIPEIQMRLII